MSVIIDLTIKHIHDIIDMVTNARNYQIWL